MKTRYTSLNMLLVIALAVSLVSIALPMQSAQADNTAQSLPFSQNWSDTGLITTNDSWSGVPGIVGFLGQDITTSTGADPQTLLGVSAAANDVDVIANQTNTNITNGGVAEFEITDPTIALQGSGTADAPHIIIYLNTTGKTNITISYNLRDIDGSADNAIQPVALQYRVGSSGNFTNLPAGFVADATTGPSLATLVTPVSVQLPAAADNQSEVQVRIITTNAVGNDEWVGIDDLSITGSAVPLPTNPTGIGAASPNTLSAGDATLLTVAVTPGTYPTSTGLSVTCGLTAIGGSAAQAFYDDGSNGDATAGDNIFSYLATVDSGTTTGSKSMDCSIADAETRSGAASIALTVQEPAAALVINEIDYDQPSTDFAEFVEIRNNDSVSVNLSGYNLELVNGNGGGAAVYQTIALPAVDLAPSGYFVVCGDATLVANCDLDVSPDSNLIQNGSPDAVGLRYGTMLIDAVSYEGDTGAPYTEGTGSGLQDDPAFTDAGISRCPNGGDTNQNNVDFSLHKITPGVDNACAPAVVINEIDYDQPSTDTAEFIEILNNDIFSFDLSKFSLELVNGNGGGAAIYQTITFPAVNLAPGAYYVVCANAATVANCDLDVSPDTNLIQNGAPDGTGLRYNGTLIDAVSYEGNTGAPYTEGSGAGLEDTAVGAQSISRCPDGSDTNQNNVDFKLRSITPGMANACFTGPTGVGAADPNVLFASDATNLSMTVTPGIDPASSGITVTCDLSAIGGSTTQSFYDDGTNGDVTAGDNIFSYATTVAIGTSDGAKSLACTIGDDQSRSSSSTIGLTVAVILPIGTVNGAIDPTTDAPSHRSPYVPTTPGNIIYGQYVTIQGVIYENTLQAISNSFNTYKGFYIQNTAATADADPNTSDGLFVFMNTSSSMPGPGGAYTPMAGDEVILYGQVEEYYNMTELVNPVLVKPVLRSGVDIEAEVPPVVADPPLNLADANRYWERLQGMRVQVPTGSLVLGGRNVFSPADAEIWVARSDSTIATRVGSLYNDYTRRAFRDANILDDNYDAVNWDGNGYRILMGSLGIKALVGDAQALIDPARTFDTVTNAPSGGLNYTFSKYRIEISAQPIFNEGVDPAANNPPQEFDRSINYSIADYNLENLYDFRNNPVSGCDFTGDSGCPKIAPFLAAVTPPYDYVPASEAAYQARVNDIALQIINDLHSPDILMVQEVENQDICGIDVTDGTFKCGTTDNADGKPDVLQDLAIQISSLGGPAYDAAFDRDSSDLRGIAPAFLYRTDRVELLPAAGDPILGADPAIVYAGATVPLNADVSNPKTLNAVLPTGITACETSWVFPRAPDIALFRIFSTSIGVGSHRDVYVINNHFKSGPDTCVPHRTEQAKYNAALVAFIQAANPNARIVLGGDLNVYPHPDNTAYGASDQLGSLYNPTLGLKNLWEVLLAQAPESAYSYVYLGMAQTLDQMFVNQAMLTDLQQFRIAHINSDFPADYPYPGDVARGTSDHDPNVATIVINDPPTVDAGGPYTVTEGNSVMLTATGTDPEGQPLTYAWDLDNNGTFETPGQSVTFTAPPNSAPVTYTVKVQVTDNGGLTAVGSATVNVIFNWTGFFNPVDNLPAWNSAKAGSAVPVKFSLGGNQGLNIFAVSYPQSVQIACDTGAEMGSPEPTANPGGSSMSYGGGKYNYVWKTEKAWAGTCRQLVVELVDGTSHQANFKFR